MDKFLDTYLTALRSVISDLCVEYNLLKDKLYQRMLDRACGNRASEQTDKDILKHYERITHILLYIDERIPAILEGNPSHKKKVEDFLKKYDKALSEIKNFMNSSTIHIDINIIRKERNIDSDQTLFEISKEIYFYANDVNINEHWSPGVKHQLYLIQYDLYCFFKSHISAWNSNYVEALEFIENKRPNIFPELSSQNSNPDFDINPTPEWVLEGTTTESLQDVENQINDISQQQSPKPFPGPFSSLSMYSFFEGQKNIQLEAYPPASYVVFPMKLPSPLVKVDKQIIDEYTIRSWANLFQTKYEKSAQIVKDLSKEFDNLDLLADYVSASRQMQSFVRDIVRVMHEIPETETNSSLRQKLKDFLRKANQSLENLRGKLRRESQEILEKKKPDFEIIDVDFEPHDEDGPENNLPQDVENNIRRMLPQEFTPYTEYIDPDEGVYHDIFLDNTPTSPYYDPDFPTSISPEEEPYIPEVSRDPDGNMIEYQPGYYRFWREAVETVEDIFNDNPELTKTIMGGAGAYYANKKVKLEPKLKKITASKAVRPQLNNNAIKPKASLSKPVTPIRPGLYGANYNGFIMGGGNLFGGGSAKSYSK